MLNVNNVDIRKQNNSQDDNDQMQQLQRYLISDINKPRDYVWLCFNGKINRVIITLLQTESDSTSRSNLLADKITQEGLRMEWDSKKKE